MKLLHDLWFCWIDCFYVVFCFLGAWPLSIWTVLLTNCIQVWNDVNDVQNWTFSTSIVSIFSVHDEVEDSWGSSWTLVLGRSRKSITVRSLMWRQSRRGPAGKLSRQEQEFVPNHSVMLSLPSLGIKRETIWQLYWMKFQWVLHPTACRSPSLS